MFGRIAPSYDALNHLLSAGVDILWRRRAVRHFQRIPLERALDLCAGTGDFAWQLHQQLPNARIVLADFSRPMLTRALWKTFPRSCFSFVECDAMKLPFPDQSFDLIICAFGLRNLADISAAVQEMHRLLKPGGQVLLLEFMKQRGGVLYSLFGLYFRWILPAIGGFISRDRGAYKYLNSSVREFLTPPELEAALQKAGFQNTRWRSYSAGICTEFQGFRENQD